MKLPWLRQQGASLAYVHNLDFTLGWVFCFCWPWKFIRVGIVSFKYISTVKPCFMNAERHPVLHSVAQCAVWSSAHLIARWLHCWIGNLTVRTWQNTSSERISCCCKFHLEHLWASQEGLGSNVDVNQFPPCLFYDLPWSPNNHCVLYFKQKLCPVVPYTWLS